MKPTTKSEIFAANLDRMMIERGLSNSRLSEWIGVSRETVSKYRSGRYWPGDIEVLCKALQCETKDLLDASPPSPPMIRISEWARREDIPLTRARDLFLYGVLHGAVQTEVGDMIIPESLTAPVDSKMLVRIAKVRPPWVPAFWTNFPILLNRKRQRKRDIANAAGVSSGAMWQWMNLMSYPKEERLPDIASALGCSVADLIADQKPA